MVDQKQSAEVVDSAVAEGGAYEIIKKRLDEQGKKLETQIQELNQARLKEFGTSEMSVIGRVRVRTENNCIARDIVQVGEHLLFGYNVFIGLKKETKIEDVFALFKLSEVDNNLEMESIKIDNTFLSDPAFIKDFEELYRYYKHTQLVELTIRNGKLLAGFQIGEKLEDIRVFRWSVSADATKIQYIDNRGERDIQLPPEYDFEWTPTTREDRVDGRHPHVNILDSLFVETIGGDLTIKIENNTEDGLGIYREAVTDETQSLDDGQFAYAKVGDLILLKVLPYREEKWRYFIFNQLTETVIRVDALGESCVQLPEDHGIMFPGGYYLQTGEYKYFDEKTEGLKFQQKVRSPNGEDVLYIFYEPREGIVGLFAYNLIEKTLKNPIYGHGYALGEDGRLVIFSAEVEPTRVHPMQIWQTPYISDEFASKAPPRQSFFGRIGNAELVRGVSDLYSIFRLINNQSVSSKLYEELSKSSKRIFDDHFWMNETEVESISATLRQITDTSELVIDEFEKVKSIQKQSNKAMQEAEQKQQSLISAIKTATWETVEEYVNALSDLRKQRGHLVTIKDLRYIDTDRVDQLDQELKIAEQELSEKTVDFLSDEKSLEPYQAKVDHFNKEVDKAVTVAELEPILESIEETTQGLDLLSELMGTLKVDDATIRTRIIESISLVYSKLNQCKANAKHKQKSMGSSEAIAQFGAQFKLFSQSISNALGASNTPEKCDEQLSRLLIQLEELESQYSEFDDFQADILEKREEIYESFESHKQQLLDEQQRKAQSVADAAARILNNIEKRSLKFTQPDELNTYFASDALAMKIREQIEQLRTLDAAIKADDIEARFKAIKEQALRSLRDKTDIYEEGGSVIKLGPRHRFSVNTQELDLTIIPRKGELNVHLTGTDYYEPIKHEELLGLRDYWEMNLESETPSVYRAEYLAALILDDAKHQRAGLSNDKLKKALLKEDELYALVREYASPRYKEGYEKGIHDHDAVQLLTALIPAIESADLLKYDPTSRGLAQIFWANIKGKARSRVQSEQEQAVLSFNTWPERARSAAQMAAVFGSSEAIDLLATEVAGSMRAFIEKHPLPVTELNVRLAADYLVAELGREREEFITSKYATQLCDALKQSMADETWRRFQMALEKMLGWPAERWNLTTAWLEAMIHDNDLTGLKRYIPEAVALINADERLERRHTEVDIELSVSGLMGDHPKIKDRTLAFGLDLFLLKMEQHRFEAVPAYHRYLDIRQRVIETEREALRLNEFKARPLSSFVRNRLINESYLPIIGDNLAKQMGTMGDSKRTDLMGLLMMISPPGYGKTTLMEYVANRLGLIFMKVNCPSLGHDVVSLDPEQAPNATARKELEKLNLALEMGNNVMLYLDDIQHTDAEFLQKFISLCDGTRRIDGVWKGKTKTYDMRGRKFCVVMAGNPYTESGETFKIPDMLANRADIYNLGDILGGMDEIFALSYLENALTSNQALAPMALRDMDDVYKLIDMAKGAEIATTDLSHQYSSAEITEIVEVLRKMMVIRDVVLKINQEYIASAAQDDQYRVEPPFKLQGSYRNMNKMSEKVSAVMNEVELMQMIADHYVGEAQLLTTGAEANLLKLAELRGNMTAEQIERWQGIKEDFLKIKALGGSETDTGTRVVAKLSELVDGVQALAEVDTTQQLAQQMQTIAQGIQSIAKGDSAEKMASQMESLVSSVRLQTRTRGDLVQQITTQLEDLNYGIRSLSKQDAAEKIAEEVQALSDNVKQLTSVTPLDTLPSQIGQVAEKISQLSDVAVKATHFEANKDEARAKEIAAAIEKLSNALQYKSQPDIKVVNQPVPGMDKVLSTLADTIQETIFPVLQSLDKKLDIDMLNHVKMTYISNQLRAIKTEIMGAKAEEDEDELS